MLKEFVIIVVDEKDVLMKERDFFIFEKNCLEEIVFKFRVEFEEVERFFIVVN